MNNSVETTDIPAFRQYLRGGLGDLDPSMSAEQVAQWKALNFLNGVEVAHAELLDKSDELTAIFFASRSRKTAQLINESKKEIYKRKTMFSLYVDLFSKIEISLEHISTEEQDQNETAATVYELATPKEQASYDMFFALFGLDYLFN